MNQERLAAKGLLADLRRQVRELDIEASALIASVRQKLSPYEDDLTKLKINEASVSMKRLEKVQAEFIEKSEKIKRIEEDLQ